jgi:hypothetical protein
MIYYFIQHGWVDGSCVIEKGTLPMICCIIVFSVLVHCWGDESFSVY